MSSSFDANHARLVVFTGCAHFVSKGRVVAHGGFVREIEVWARIFPRVLIVTVHGYGEPPGDAIPYTAPGVSCSILSSASRTTGLRGKCKLAALTWRWTTAALPLLKPDDVLMARGPDSLGFLGGVLARIKGLRRFAKYADQWQPFPREPLGYRLQKLFYRTALFAAPVQIYGNSDPRRPHLLPFFTSSLSESEWLQAGKWIENRTWAPPWRILFCGRFVSAKGIDLLLRAFKVVLESGIDASLELVGDGEEMSSLVELSRTLGVQNRVVFHGWLGRDALIEQYRRAHLFVSSSRKEGFGKVIIEAMSFGLPVVATDVGVSRLLVNPPECGVVAQPESAQRLADCLLKVISQPEYAVELGRNSRVRSRNFLFEKLENQYRDFLAINCGFAPN